jgi:hypothetical protein
MPTRTPYDYEDEDSAPPLTGPRKSTPPTGSAGTGSAGGVPSPPSHVPSSSSAVTTPAVPAPSTAPPSPFCFGVCGILEKVEELETELGQTGIVRYVTSGVSYTAPPSLGQNGTWRKHPTDSQRFESVWDVRKSRNLHHLREMIAQAVQSGAILNPDCEVRYILDTVVDRLVRHVVQLNQHGWSVGLICPDNVYFQDDSYDLFLVDLGFHWLPSRGEPPWEAEPGRPDWVDDRWTYARFYSRPPLQQQFAHRSFAPQQWDGQPFSPPTPTEDVQCLARLILWLVSGDDQSPIRATPFIDLLCKAIDGYVATPADFLHALQECPPSTHFGRIPLAPEKPKKSLVRRGWWVALILIGIVMAGGYIYFRSGTSSSTSGSSALSSLPAPDTWQQESYERQMQFWREYNDQSPRNEEEKATLVNYRLQTLDKLAQKYDQLVEASFKHAERFTVAHGFQKLYEDMQLLRSRPIDDPELVRRERLWLEILKLRVQELEGVPPS